MKKGRPKSENLKKYSHTIRLDSDDEVTLQKKIREEEHKSISDFFRKSIYIV